MTDRIDERMAHEWHVAINQHNRKGGKGLASFMYEAKTMADEVPRMVMLFCAERTDALPNSPKQCSMTPAVQVKDNHLSCCLGVKCRECPELLALEKMERPPGDIDIAKAWTCAAHIVSKGGDIMREGYLLRVDDRMYWDNVYSSLAQGEQP